MSGTLVSGKLLTNMSGELPLKSMKITCIGDVAFDALRRHESKAIHGSVHSVFRRCAYLQFDQSIFCLAESELGAGPINILFDAPGVSLLNSLSPGQNVVMSSVSLILSADQIYSMRFADVHESKISAYRVTDEHVTEINLMLRELQLPSDGIAQLLQTRTNLAHASIVLKFVAPAINEFLIDLKTQLKRINVVPHSSSWSNNASWFRLVGAGPGLTPSGDDFLCGAFHALYLTGYARIASDLWCQMVGHCRNATTDIAFALLQQSANGRQSERVSLLTSELFGEHMNCPNRVGQQLSSVGASSGWDWFTGFVMCLNTISESSVNDIGSTKTDAGRIAFTESSSSGVHLVHSQ